MGIGVRMSVEIDRFESIEAYARACAELGVLKNRDYCHTDRSWSMGVTTEQAHERALTGDLTIASKAMNSVDRINANTHVDAPRMGNAISLTGTRVDVPAYLSNSPFCMRRRVRMPRATRHVSIYMGLVSNCTVRADSMLERGCMILGLLETLQAMQVAIDLFLVAETSLSGYSGDLFQVIKVESRPLDLSVAGFAIAHPAFTRTITYPYAYLRGAAHSIPRPESMNHGSCSSPEYVQHVRESLQLNPEDLYLPSLWDTNQGDPLEVTAAFVNNTLSQFA